MIELGLLVLNFKIVVDSARCSQVRHVVAQLQDRIEDGSVRTREFVQNTVGASYELATIARIWRQIVDRTTFTDFF